VERQTYYKSEIFRVLLYPLVFLLVVFIFVALHIYVGEPIDIWLFMNLTVVALTATLICYFITYKMVRG